MQSPAASDIAQVEAHFHEQFPDYRSLLDAAAIARDMQSLLDRSVRHDAPFAHVWVEGFLPEPFYRLLDAVWPPLSAYRASRNLQKLNMVPGPDVGDDMSGRYSELPAAFKEVWDFFIEHVNRRVVAPWLRRVFAPEIEQRIALLQQLAAEKRLGFSASGLAAGRFDANRGRLMVRGEGYVLKPHVNPAHYLVTVLHYFADRRDEGFGTRLYRAAAPIPVDAFVRDGTTQYFKDSGIAVEESSCLPFVRNGFLAFPNLLDAAHGVVAPEAGYRRVYQYHLSLRGDGEPL